MSAADTPGGNGRHGTGNEANQASHDAKVVADLRSNRALQNAREVDDRWSMRLTFGEIDALLRIADERDDLKRRLIGEWEGDVPEPLPVVDVVQHEGTLGEDTPYEVEKCAVCDESITRRGGSWWHVEIQGARAAMKRSGIHAATPVAPTLRAFEMCAYCGTRIGYVGNGEYVHHVPPHPSVPEHRAALRIDPA